ncbi:DUF4192 family protein [Couchioplanes caeruleus]|uniref:Uncharacterized protein DUF4192 n=1 Tax=Couchioplanes caeruleus TaxID=56438 RepID=A0A3N1GLU7_9ACTN|nr:DUF4192 family protein [Couchioplanes caeruleus]ROP31171.1 uncharacterized protein DUF4192 [Couchioplanes caeruleus]
MTKLKVRTPADLIAAVPFLIGFHPADSLVVAAVTGAKLAFAARIDLPEPGVPDLEAQARVLHLASLIVEQWPEAIALIGYGDSDRVTPSLLHLSQALTSAGLHIIDEFRVADGRYWSYRCTKQTCCPEDGRPCDPPDSVVAAEATFAGAVALPSRKDLEAQLAPVTGPDREAMDSADERALSRLLDLLPQAPLPDDGGLPQAPLPHDGGTVLSAEERCRSERLILRAGRTAVRSAERRYRSGGRLSDDEVAWLGYLLTSIPVRDYAWIRSGTDGWQIALWSDVVRRVAPQRVPAPASLLAFIAWRASRGALAAIAVERAREADPHYALAETMNATLYAAVPPSAVAGWPTPTGRPAPKEPGYACAEEEGHLAESGDSRPSHNEHEAVANEHEGVANEHEAAANEHEGVANEHETPPHARAHEAGSGEPDRPPKPTSVATVATVSPSDPAIRTTEQLDEVDHGTLPTEAVQRTSPGAEADQKALRGGEAEQGTPSGAEPGQGTPSGAEAEQRTPSGGKANQRMESDRGGAGAEGEMAGPSFREPDFTPRKTRTVRTEARSCGRPAWTAGHRTTSGGTAGRRTVRRRR